MNTKTMEGIVGAKTSTDLLNTPMQIFKEAQQKGDTATMERAMGYAVECADKAEEYKAKADKGMEDDAREAKEKAKLESEKVMQKRREEREKLEERIEESRTSDDSIVQNNTDTVEISAEGSEAAKNDSGEIKADVPGEAVTYTKTGEVNPDGQSAGSQGANISVAV